MAGIGKSGAMQGFERMEDKVEALENSSDVDQQLEALKAKMKKPQTPPTEGGA
jgi:phage shock protein A